MEGRVVFVKPLSKGNLQGRTWQETLLLHVKSFDYAKCSMVNLCSTSGNAYLLLHWQSPFLEILDPTCLMHRYVVLMSGPKITGRRFVGFNHKKFLCASLSREMLDNQYRLPHFQRICTIGWCISVFRETGHTKAGWHGRAVLNCEYVLSLIFWCATAAYMYETSTNAYWIKMTVHTSIRCLTGSPLFIWWDSGQAGGGSW